MKSSLLGEFDSFKERVLALRPPIYLEDLRAAWLASGQAIGGFVDGEISKKELIAAEVRLATQIQAAQRFLFLENSNDLGVCLLYHGKNFDYALEQRKHEEDHVQLYRSFRPLNGDQPPEAGYAVYLTSDRYIVPYAIPYRRVWPFGMRRSLEQDPYRLYKEWSTATLRAWFLHLRAGVDDPSEGDRLVLGLD